MLVIGREIIEKFLKRHTDLTQQADVWWAEAVAAHWRRPSDIKAKYATASFLSDNRVLFNLKGNHYRLLVQVHFESSVVLILKIGTHEQYSRWKL